MSDDEITDFEAFRASLDDTSKKEFDKLTWREKPAQTVDLSAERKSKVKNQIMKLKKSVNNSMRGETEACKRFEHYFRDEFLYCSETKDWHQFKQGAWSGDAYSAVYNEMKETTYDLNTKGSNAFVESAVRAARHLDVFRVAIDGWNPHPDELSTLSGVVDLRTGRIRPSAPEDRIRIQVPLEVKDIPTPRFDAFMQQITCDDRALEDFIMRLIGYFLTGSTREQKLYFFHGVGSNGKGVLANIIRGIMGKHIRAGNAELMLKQAKGATHLNKLEALNKRRLVVIDELPVGAMLNEMMIKTITGGTHVVANKMHKDEIEFKPQFKLIILNNSMPNIMEVDPAMRRRIRIVPFKLRLAENQVDLDFMDKITEEFPGILYKAIQAAVAYFKDGLEEPEIVQRESNNYLDDSDTLGAFIEECCLLADSAQSITVNDVVLLRDLHRLFNSWRFDQGFSSRILQKTFKEMLTKRGFFVGKRRVGGIEKRGVFGLRIDPNCPLHR